MPKFQLFLGNVEEFSLKLKFKTIYSVIMHKQNEAGKGNKIKFVWKYFFNFVQKENKKYFNQISGF